MAELNTAYGGHLIRQFCERSQFGSLPRLELDPVKGSDFVNIASGAFSPLTGFMNEECVRSVCEKRKLSFVDLPWTIPILLDLPELEISRLKKEKAVVVVSGGKELGVFEFGGAAPFNKPLYIRNVFQTESREHPGVRYIEGLHDSIVWGKCTLFKDAVEENSLTDPLHVRNLLKAKGLTKVAGFQTRNVVHRAHEHQHRTALDLCRGLLLQPIVGWKKKGDFEHKVIQAAYRRYIDTYLPEDKVTLAFLNTPMRYAGPREAVFHAIVRRNFGCSHFIVGRDHAGVGGFYGIYAAHEIFDELPSLGIEILRLSEPFFCEHCQGMTTENCCRHPESQRVRISGTKVRAMLTAEVPLDDHYLRPEVYECVRQFKKGELFVE